MALRLDQEGAIRVLQADGISTPYATSIVHVVHDYLVAPIVERVATKNGEKSARGRLRNRIDAAVDDIAILKVDVAELKSDVATLKIDVAGLKSDVTTLKIDMVDVKSRLKRLEDQTRAILWGLGASTAFLGLLIAIIGLAK